MPVDRQVVLNLAYRSTGGAGAASHIKKATAEARALETALRGVTAAAKQAGSAVGGLRGRGGGGPRVSAQRAGAIPFYGSYNTINSRGQSASNVYTPPMMPTGKLPGVPLPPGMYNTINSLGQVTRGAYTPPMGQHGWISRKMGPIASGLAGSGALGAGGIAAASMAAGGSPLGLIISEVKNKLSSLVNFSKEYWGSVFKTITQWGKDTLGFVGKWGGKMFNLLAMPFRHFGDFIYRFVRWQITWGLIAMFTGISTAVVKSINDFAAFESKVMEAVTVTGLFGREAKKAHEELSKFAILSSFQTMLQPQDMAGVLYALGSAGLNVGEQQQVAPGTAALAVATASDPKQSAELVMSTIRALKMEFGETDRVVNTFAAGIGMTRLNMERLGTAIPYVISTAGNLSMTVERVVAILGLLSNNGMQASRTGTGLRRMFGALLKPTKEAVDVLHKYGIRVRDVNVQYNDFFDVLHRLKPLQQSQADMARVFGLRGWEAANILIAQVDSLQKLERQITGTNRAYEMQAMMMNTTHGQAALLLNALNALSWQFGKGMSPWLINMMAGIRERLEKLFDTEKMVAVGNAIGQWFNNQFWKAVEWLESGKAKEWFEDAIDSAKELWNTVKFLGRLAMFVAALLRRFMIYNKEAIEDIKKFVGVITAKTTTMAVEKLGNMLNSINPEKMKQFAEDIRQMIPIALLYADIWLTIFGIKTSVLTISMRLLGTLMQIAALMSVFSPITVIAMKQVTGIGPKELWEHGKGLKERGERLAGTRDEAVENARDLLRQFGDTIQGEPIVPETLAGKVAEALVDAMFPFGFDGRSKHDGKLQYELTVKPSPEFRTEFSYRSQTPRTKPGKASTKINEALSPSY